LRLCGELAQAEVAALQSVQLAHDATDNLWQGEPWWQVVGRRPDLFAKAVAGNLWKGEPLWRLGLVLAARGQAGASAAALDEALRLLPAADRPPLEGGTLAFLAQRARWLGDPTSAVPLSERAWELAHAGSFERDFPRAARLQGAAALGVGDLARAEERLHTALTRARAVRFVEEETPTLTARAELPRRRGEPERARELLEDVWEPAERGPYPLLHADALNVLAQIERDAGNREAAVAAA